MANSRTKLQALLEQILGSQNVYFQPPETLKMRYPAIVYALTDIQTIFADDAVYKKYRVYRITFISSDPDSELTEKLLQLPMCRFNSRFTADGLYHDVFTVYF